MVSLNSVDFKASKFLTFSYFDLRRVLLAAVLTLTLTLTLALTLTLTLTLILTLTLTRAA